MSTEADSPDGEHGSEGESDDQTETEREDVQEIEFRETLPGDVLDDPMVLRAEGPAVQRSEQRDRQTQTRDYDLAIEEEVFVQMSVPILTSGDLEDCILGDNKSTKTGYNKHRAVEWGLKQIDREDLEMGDREDWQVRITGDASTYVQLAKMESDLDLSNSRGRVGLTPGPLDVLEGLYRKGLFCQSLLIAWIELAKQMSEDYSVPLRHLQEESEDDS